MGGTVVSLVSAAASWCEAEDPELLRWQAIDLKSSAAMLEDEDYQPSSKVQEGFKANGATVALAQAEGVRLARSMGPLGVAALERWRAAWEPQERGHFCAPASMLAALRILRLEESWTQSRIFDEVVWPKSLFTRGVSFAHGAELARLLSAGRFSVEERSSTDEAEMALQLRKDLTEAILQNQDICVLANYWRPTGGHWSPVAGLAEEQVLVLDTNAKRLPVHWVPLAGFVAAMCRINDYTSKPRGYIVLKAAKTVS